MFHKPIHTTKLIWIIAIPVSYTHLLRQDRLRSSGNACPASCWGSYRCGTGSKPAQMCIRDSVCIGQGCAFSVKTDGLYDVPVSYTHLDVYKRQLPKQTSWRLVRLKAILEKAALMQADRSRTGGMFHAPKSSPWGEVQNCETLCPGVFLVSVSYTHLDVYKRQAILDVIVFSFPYSHVGNLTK